MEPMPFTVATLQRKGGVGKSTMCASIAGSLSRDGLRVLLVDMDPQASISNGFLSPTTVESLPVARTVAALFDDRLDPTPADLLCPTGITGITLLPGSHHLDAYNVPNPQNAGELQGALRVFLKETRDAFDVTIIDCPPNLHLCSWTALVAADFVLIPLQAEDYGAQGITHVQRAVDLALLHKNPRLRLLGYLVTMVTKRLGVHVSYERQLRDLYADQVFTATIPLAKDFKEAVASRQPVTHYKPRSAAAKAVKAVAQEMLARAAAAAQRPPEFLYLENRLRPQDAERAA